MTEILEKVQESIDRIDESSAQTDAEKQYNMLVKEKLEDLGSIILSNMYIEKNDEISALVLKQLCAILKIGESYKTTSQKNFTDLILEIEDAISLIIKMKIDLNET